jgi:hypothetical protein
MVSKRKHRHKSKLAVFQAQTATGKLNAEMILQLPLGGIAHTCGVPDAQSAWLSRVIDEKVLLQSQIISCTSPYPSCNDFPFHKKLIY